MENKIKKIVEILNGETIENCLTIMSKVTCEINDKKTELKEKLIFKI